MYFFFFKQRTAYEIRISDWSSDVCSSDLISLSLVAGTTAAGAYDCEAEVKSTLQEHGIAQSDVESAKLLRRSPGKSPSSYRPDKRRVGKACVSTFRSRGSP